MDEINVTEQFKQMMTNPNIGHNGGNERATLWFVGLECNAGAGCQAHNENLLSGTVTQLKVETYDRCPFNRALFDMLGAKKSDCLYGQRILVQFYNAIYDKCRRIL